MWPLQMVTHASPPRDIAKLINKSQSSVKIVSGCLERDIWGKNQVTMAIRKALQRGVKFQVIVGPEPDQGSIVSEMLKDVIYLVPKWPEHHVILVDGRHFRYEKGHLGRGVGPTAYQLLFNVPSVVTYFAGLFEDALKECRPYAQ